MAMMGWANDDGTGHAARLAGEYVNIRPLIGVGFVQCQSSSGSHVESFRVGSLAHDQMRPCRPTMAGLGAPRPPATWRPSDLLLAEPHQPAARQG